MLIQFEATVAVFWDHANTFCYSTLVRVVHLQQVVLDFSFSFSFLELDFLVDSFGVLIMSLCFQIHPE